MTNDAACPDRADLERLILGQLSEGEMDAMERHLAVCSRCGDTLSQVRASDTLLNAFQAQAGAVPPPEQEVVSALVERLSALQGTSQLHFAQGDTREVKADSAALGGGWRELLAPPERPDELGRLGGYRVLKVLGVGGMGVVF